MSAVYVLWLRQLIRFWRTKSRVIGALAQPLLFLVALGFGLGPIYEQAGGGNYIQFLAPGIIAMTILFSAMFTGMEVIWDRQMGFLKETLVSPSSRTSIFVGRTLGGATVAMFQGIMILIITLIVGFRPTSFVGFILALIFMFMLAFIFTALGTAFASKVQDMQAFPAIINFIMMPVFFLSGALFPLESAPMVMKVISIFDPLSYQVDALRELLTGASHFGLGIDFVVTTLCITIVTSLGIYFFKKIEA